MTSKTIPGLTLTVAVRVLVPTKPTLPDDEFRGSALSGLRSVLALIAAIAILVTLGAMLRGQL